jgi:uncharacterized protein (TIGR02246 family)
METIDDVIRQTELAFNAGDAEALAGTFTEDAWSVGVTGQVLHGREEILGVSRRLFGGALKGQFAKYVVDEVRHLAPDVAIARKLAYATDDQGNGLDADHAMVALYVLVRVETGWRVVARQNTIVER